MKDVKFDCVCTDQSIFKCEDPHISSVMNMISSHDRIGKVFNPDSSECVSRYFIILISSLGIVGDIKTDIFTIAYITVFDDRICTSSTNANSSTD